MSREDRIETIRSEIKKGEYLTDEKLDVAADEIQRDLCGCSSHSAREAGLIITVCVASLVAFVVSVAIWQMIWGGFGETVTP